MKQPVVHHLFGIFLTLGLLSLWLPATIFSSFSIQKASTTATLPSASQTMSCPNDSLVLVALYNALNGPNWTNSENWLVPGTDIGNWFGVTTGPNGCVTELNLGSNNLSGVIPPEIGDFSGIFFLYLHINNISGNIPPEIGNLTNLARLWLDNNNLSGNLPEEIGNLTGLQVLWLDNNNLTGPILDSFINFINLNDLRIENNYFDSFPDLSSLPFGTDLQLQANKLTFDDILPNITPLNIHGGFYEPQDSAGTIQFLTACEGQSFTIDLGFDAGVSSNVYEWSYNGGPYGGFQTVIGTNQLTLDNVMPGDGGIFRCRVTNPNAPELTLFTMPIFVQVECCNVENLIDSTLCPGETLVVNGVTYGQPPLPSFGIEEFNGSTSCGADSTVIINLSFFAEADSTIQLTLCNDESITVNGVVYDVNNPAGEEVIQNSTPNGCDSTVTIDLAFLETDTTVIDPLLCPGSSVSVNNQTYNEAMPSGTEIMTNEAGCDSVILINLSFAEEIRDTLNEAICQGESFFFDNTNLTATDTYKDTLLSDSGCDSIVTLNLIVNDTFLTNIVDTVCASELVMFNGDTIFASGTYFDTLSTQNGCDSLIVFDITLLDPIPSFLTVEICQGETYIFNTDTLSQPDIYVDTMPAQNGCDSIVSVELIVYDTFQTVIQEEICAGEIFDFFNQSLSQSGTYEEVLTTQEGCDSSIILELMVRDTYETVINASICQGNTYNFFGQELTQADTYEEVLVTQFGCDSTFILNLSVSDTFQTTMNETICEGDTFFFFNQPLTLSNQYEEIIPSSNGCDSIITLNLTVNDTFIINQSAAICQGETYDFLGQQLTNGGDYQTTLITQDGCDSTFNLNLLVFDTFEVTIDTAICAGETVQFFNNTLFEEGTYTEILSTQNGCDSTIILQLTVNDTFQFVQYDTICEGETFQFFDLSLTNTGTYMESFATDLAGCDSTYVLYLTVNDTFNFYESATICQGETYSFFGQELSNSGNYEQSYLTAEGCDSIYFLELVLLDTAQTIINDTICANGFYPFNNEALNQSGTYRDTLGAVNGCDSFVVLHLTVLDTFHTFLSEEICAGNSLTFNGSSLTDSSIYLDTLEASNGCDSFVHLTLIVLDTFHTFLNASICEGDFYNFNGQTLSEEGTYLDTLVSQNGCDSIFSLQLEVNEIPMTTLNEFICKGESILVNGKSFDQTGQYEEVITGGSISGCDSIVLLNLTVADVATFGAAEAGDDFTSCTDTEQLQANLPDSTFGKWLFSDVLVVEGWNSPTSTVTNLQPGPNWMIWSLSTSFCEDYDQDSILIFRENRPLANEDFVLMPFDSKLVTIDVLENDELAFVSGWFVEEMNQPSLGILENQQDGTFNFEVETAFEEDLSFTYELCNDLCPDLCDTALVRILMEAGPEPLDTVIIPNAFTPNDDGVNDTWVIDGLDKYPDNEVVIFNRWGDIVFETQSYNNDWGGEYQKSGKSLPQATYYYILRLNVPGGKIYRGDITILK